MVASTEQVCLRLRLVKRVKLIDEILYVDFTSLHVNSLSEDELWVLAKLFLDVIEHSLDDTNALLDLLRHLKV